LIRQQPVTGIGLKRLARTLRTSQLRLRERDPEFGVPLVFGNASDGAADTRTLRSAHGFVDPPLERLKDLHGK